MARRRRMTRAQQRENAERLDAFFKEAGYRVQRGIIAAIDHAADEVANTMVNDFYATGHKSHTGSLVNEIRHYVKADAVADKELKSISKHAMMGADLQYFYSAYVGDVDKNLSSDPKKPGIRNPNMKGRYPVSYMRLQEFSPMLSKDGSRSFFFMAWYMVRAKVINDIQMVINRAWADKLSGKV